MPIPIPDFLQLNLLQYDRKYANPEIKVGDQVLKYQRLACATSNLGTAIHAPTSGTITAIDIDANGCAHSIELQSDGEDAAIDLHIVELHTLNPQELLLRIQAAGICGMGGAGFPAAEKIRCAKERGCELLIVNAIECEPYISADQALIRERAEGVVSGAEIVKAASGAERCVIVIESDMEDAIAPIKEALKYSAIELLIAKTKYPSGNEQQIVQLVTGREVPVHGLPIDLGVLTLNAGTAYACHQAVVEGKSCISRITTMAGSILQTPKNFEALIGTSVSFLFELCGIDKSRHTKSILGGSLMGIEITGAETYVEKTTNCLIAVSTAEFPPPLPEQDCIRCGYCSDACPISLLPQQLYTFSRAHDREQLNEHGLIDCIECGACDYVCPSHIPLVQYFRASKSEMQHTLDQRQQGQYWQSRFQYHQYRIKKDKEAMAERRKPVTVATSTAIETEPGQPASLDRFSRDQAKIEIADAVKRAKARLAQKAAQQRSLLNQNQQNTDGSNPDKDNS